MLPGKSISFKLAVFISGFIFMLLLILGAFIYTYMNYDMSIVDLAGRQRMLLQRYSKEFFLTEVVPAQVRHSTLKAAEDINTQITGDRAEYTKMIMKLSEEVEGVKLTQDWKHEVGAVPLPVTFIKEVSEKIKKDGGYSFDLVSKWNINSEKNLKTPFEEDAFKALQIDSENPYYEFLEYESVFVLRYATADTATSKGCVSCHNSTPNSPKKDFKLGDLMGILVTTIPITDDVPLGKKTFYNEEIQPGNEKYNYTAKIFEKTMNGFMYGGKVPLNLEMTKFKTISPVGDVDILDKLKKGKRQWEVMLKDFEALRSLDINSSEYLSTLIELEKHTGLPSVL